KALGRTDNPPEFQLGVFEIQNESDRKIRDLEVIKHLSDLVISDPLDGFGVDDHLVERDEVRHKLRDLDSLIEQRKSRLLGKWNGFATELHSQRIFIRLFMKAMPHFVKHRE